MSERSRREVLGLLTAGAAASLLTKPAFAQVTGGKKKYISITVGSENEALLGKVAAAINEAIAKTGGAKLPGGTGPGPAGEWAQDGGWYQDLTGGGWSQSGGWVRDLQGRVGRLSEVEARSNTQLVSVRGALAQATIAGAANIKQ